MYRLKFKVIPSLQFIIGKDIIVQMFRESRKNLPCSSSSHSSDSRDRSHSSELWKKITQPLHKKITQSFEYFFFFFNFKRKIMHYLPTYLPTYRSDSSDCSDSSDSRDSSDSSE